MCKIIEEHLVVPYAKLEEHSIYQESLEVKESLQYRNRGLIHISDNAFVFFMALEQQGVSLLNHTKVRKLRGDLVSVASQDLMKNEDLREKWAECFDFVTVTSHKVTC